MKLVESVSELHHSTEIFTDNIELQIYNTSYFKCMEIGMFVSIGNNGYLKSILRRITNCQTYSIYRYRTFIDGKITTLSHFWIKIVFKGEIPAAFGVIYCHASSGLINMSLYDMPVQTSVHHHAALYINFITCLQQADIGPLNCFFHSGNRICTILNANYGQADAVMRYALVNFQFIHK